MSLAKRQHEERESVSSLFFMRQKKKFESELNFAATNSPIQLLLLHAHLGLPWSLHLHYLNFRHIVYVYTSSIRRIFYVLFSLPYLSPSPSLFLEFFSYFIWDIPGIFSRIFFVLYSIYVVYSWKFFLEFFQNFFLYILYMSWFFQNFFRFSSLGFPKIFLLIQYICSSFFGIFSYICSIYVVYMQQFFFLSYVVLRAPPSRAARDDHSV